MMLWGHRASDIHPSFVLGLRAIIICKKDNGDHGNPEKKSDLVANTIFQSLLKKKISTAGKHIEHSGRAIIGKAAASPLNALQLTLWPH